MATKKDINQFLKETGYTMEEMDTFFAELKPVNKLVAQLIKQNVSWTKLNMSVIKSLPTQKERDIARLEKEKKESKAKEEKDKQQREAKVYYEENFETIMYDAIVSGQAIKEEEIRCLIGEYEVESEEGEEYRWTRAITTIVKLKDKHFAIQWNRGLTENQENEYSKQPYEVTEKEKVIAVKYWSEVS